ncbi:MAG: TonB-dependent receptor, partial [Muribaculaceae bacterium]|nr:TonB-dependent receptor [Muribaculaceae bacterium]
FDENALEDEEGAGQSIASLVGASDNIYYNAANYDFSAMYFRQRGYERSFQQTYINGINMNDMARGMFNYSSLGGLNRAFRNQTSSIGIDANGFGFGNIGGATNINTLASSYAPGFYGSVMYTNSNYKFRAMGLYSTGLNKQGWAVTIGAVGRYADEGVVPGSFYNSGGYFLAVEKVFNPAHSLALTAFGAPTQRAGASPVVDEVRELTGNNLYNPNWGWQDGKKRASRIVETFDPTFLLNWIFKPNSGTSLNTGVGVRWVNYSTSALAYYNAENPAADYYRKLPSWYAGNEEMYDLYTDLWMHNQSVSQINWDNLYRANYAINDYNADPANADRKRGAAYIQENRHSNQFNVMFNSTLNHRLNDYMALQAGVGANYTSAAYYKTVRDLLGGEYWLDVDMYTEGNYPENPNIAINDLNNPMAKAVEGDKFGYWYNLNALNVNAWLQNTINLSHWDINYGMQLSYTQFQRDGKMRNGRAPRNSYGKGEIHRFDNGSIKAGATYKIDGRNFLMAHMEYGTQAPLMDRAYVAPRTKDEVMDGVTSERIFSVDMSYVWNYRRFRGTVTGFYTDMTNGVERSSFFDDNYGSFMNYVLTGVHKKFKGIELGMAYKITQSITASLAGTVASYRYKNNPVGTRSYDNGTMPDTTQVVYYKNHRISGTPQTAVSLGIDWAAPHQWFFSINGAWMGNSYVNMSPVRYEVMPNLWEKFPTSEALEAKVRDLATQEKLNDAFVLNASIGKLIY